MEIDPNNLSDEEVVALAQAERDAGIPDQQTASAAAAAKLRLAQEDDCEEVKVPN